MISYVQTEAPDPRDLPKCKEAGEYVNRAYPGYDWFVEIVDGMLTIRSWKVASNAGFRVPLRSFDGDATRFKREVIMAAGAFLEAAHLKRGLFQGETAKILEGLPKGQKASLFKQPKIYSPDELIVDV